MGTYMVERWRCDRCHVESEKWLKPATAYNVTASVDMTVAGGNIIAWREMCVACNSTVSKEIEAMKASATADRKAQP